MMRNLSSRISVVSLHADGSLDVYRSGSRKRYNSDTYLVDIGPMYIAFFERTGGDIVFDMSGAMFKSEFKQELSFSRRFPSRVYYTSRSMVINGLLCTDSNYTDKSWLVDPIYTTSGQQVRKYSLFRSLKLLSTVYNKPFTVPELSNMYQLLKIGCNQDGLVIIKNNESFSVDMHGEMHKMRHYCEDLYVMNGYFIQERTSFAGTRIVYVVRADKPYTSCQAVVSRELCMSWQKYWLIDDNTYKLLSDVIFQK